MTPMLMPIVELRQYTLRPGQRDVLIDLFEREFIEGHLAALAQSTAWRGVAEELQRRLKGQPEVLRLQPTPRYQLVD